MSGPTHDLIGKRFGKLTVLSLSGKSNDGHYMWRCVCDCGNFKNIIGYSLRRGGTKGCGCLKGKNIEHGLSYFPVYRIWAGMKTRCYNKKDPSYDNYGGRGILMCEAVKNSASAIVETIGHRPGKLTIDRIDNNLGYHCGKCEECARNGWGLNMRWATVVEQGENQRTNKLITINGVTKTQAVWARESGIKRITIAARIKRGWGSEKLLVPV